MADSNLKEVEREICIYESPIGRMIVSASERGIDGLFFCDEKESKVPREICEDSEILSSCISQLDEYFKGKRTSFDVPLDLKGTQFRRLVWDALLLIPYGETVSYGKVAEMIENPKAVRAVGGANNANPVSIIVPCHRVVGSDGKLTGYGGGLWRKEWLLEHESKTAKRR